MKKSRNDDNEFSQSHDLSREENKSHRREENDRLCETAEQRRHREYDERCHDEQKLREEYREWKNDSRRNAESRDNDWKRR